MKRVRVIARLDVKNEYVIKGIHLEGLRKIGNPVELAASYYKQGADEIIFMDAVASLYDRNNLFHIIEKACQHVFVPITIGGGIRSVENISEALQAGADKVAINSAAVKRPAFITEAATIFGSQCIIGSIEAKRKGQKWEVYIDNGRESTGLDALEWALQLEAAGAGEILLTSIDQEGTKKGFDVPLIREFSKVLRVPLVVCGGAGNSEHIKAAAGIPGVDGIALASVLHYNLLQVQALKKELEETGIEVNV